MHATGRECATGPDGRGGVGRKQKMEKKKIQCKANKNILLHSYIGIKLSP